jgi:hypothetical protein
VDIEAEIRAVHRLAKMQTIDIATMMERIVLLLAQWSGELEQRMRDLEEKDPQPDRRDHWR